MKISLLDIATIVFGTLAVVLTVLGILMSRKIRRTLKDKLKECASSGPVYHEESQREPSEEEEWVLVPKGVLTSLYTQLAMRAGLQKKVNEYGPIEEKLMMELHEYAESTSFLPEKQSTKEPYKNVS